MKNRTFNNLQVSLLKELGLDIGSDAADIEDAVSTKLIREGFDKSHKNINQTGIICESILDVIGDE